MRVLFAVLPRDSSGELRTVLPIITEADRSKIECTCFIYKDTQRIIPHNLNKNFFFWEEGEEEFYNQLKKSSFLVFADYSSFGLPFKHKSISRAQILKRAKEMGIKLGTLDYFGLCFAPNEMIPEVNTQFQFGSPFLQKILRTNTESFFINVPEGMKVFRPCPINWSIFKPQDCIFFYQVFQLEYPKAKETFGSLKRYIPVKNKKIFVQLVSNWLRPILQLIYGERGYSLGCAITGILYNYLHKLYGDRFAFINISPFPIGGDNVINKIFMNQDELYVLLRTADLTFLYNIFSSVLVDCIIMNIPAVSICNSIPISRAHLSLIKGRIAKSGYESIVSLLGDQEFPPFKALGIFYENALYHLLDNNPYFQAITIVDLFDEEKMMALIQNPSYKKFDLSSYKDLPSFWEAFFYAYDN